MEEEKIAFEEEDIEKGRKAITKIALVIIGLDVLSLLVLLMTGNIGSFGTGFVRIIFTCLLFYCLYKGYSWAKTLTIILFLIALVISLVSAFILEHSIVSVFMFLYCGLSVYVVCLLAFSSNVREFLKYQKHLRENNAWWK